MKWNLLGIILGFLDILAITLAFQLSFSLNYNNWNSFFFSDKTLIYLYIGVMPVWLIILYFIKIAEVPRTKRYRMLFFEYIQSALFIAVLFVFIYFALRLYMVPRRLLANICFFGFVFLFILRLVEYKFFKSYRTRGYDRRNIVIIADETAIPFIESLQKYTEWGYNIKSIFTGSEKIRMKYGDTLIKAPKNLIKDLNNIMEVDLIDEVIYFKDKIMPSETRQIIRSCEELGVTFRIHMNNPDENLSNAIRIKLGKEYFLTFSNVPYKTISLAAKRFMDVSVSLLMLVFFLPFMIFAALAIKFSSEGPVIFRQERVGLRGRKFKILKFRTMFFYAESMQEELAYMNVVDGPAFKIENDPRVTKIGRFLRRTGLDELPQLFNVLKGEMSLVGPRPPLENETKQYERWHLRRLSVKPGLSCFWQLKSRKNSVNFEEWMEMDLAYIDNWSFRLDLIILVRTIRTVLLRVIS
ncbi:MAG: sugar transferase [Bacteroidales bacterium]|nr:sugar transferase [Bacteroidales bacterium]